MPIFNSDRHFRYDFLTLSLASGGAKRHHSLLGLGLNQTNPERHVTIFGNRTGDSYIMVSP
ncbi:hypothetical protein H6F42_03560 [Pseudanabaena sp. FACHB-1998]|nr:hypothetical protein [Pseudanabaena sp. FACHB-1998]